MDGLTKSQWEQVERITGGDHRGWWLHIEPSTGPAEVVWLYHQDGKRCYDLSNEPPKRSLFASLCATKAQDGHGLELGAGAQAA